MTLQATLLPDRQTVEVSLRNTGHRTFLATLGAHIGRSCSPAFRFSIRGEHIPNTKLLTSCGELKDQPAFMAGQFDSWVLFMPGGASYGMTFPLNSLRLMSRLRTSVADLMNRSWTLSVSYSGVADREYLDEWKMFHHSGPSDPPWSRPVPFWTGTLETSIPHQLESSAK